jgi:hypothetical protein
VFPPGTLLECLAKEDLNPKQRLLRLQVTVNPDTLLQKMVCSLRITDGDAMPAPLTPSSDLSTASHSRRRLRGFPGLSVEVRAPEEDGDDAMADSESLWA